MVAVGYWYGIPPIVAGLFLIGFGNGTWDVAMNVEGAAVEQRLRRAIMPKFHAGFSVGTVAGALGGAAMVALGVPVTAHLIGVASWSWYWSCPVGAAASSRPFDRLREPKALSLRRPEGRLTDTEGTAIRSGRGPSRGPC